MVPCQVIAAVGEQRTSVRTDWCARIKILKNVSCEYDRWVVETQLCKLREMSDKLIGRACAMFQLKYLYKYGVCELHIYDMVVDTQLHKFYGRPFARVLYLFIHEGYTW